ncbi:MAG: hypothetical protein KAY32_05855 [Candidatus Eisenbacteria sp.]|nr:hypothetical protein [Candidatus Eisenbacteria bacterium]
MDLRPETFIFEPVTVCFDTPPLFEKRPGCPQAFTWRGKPHTIQELLSEWHDYGRRGRMTHNMRPEHLVTARKRGSWGVGRDYFRVRTSDGRYFDLCYDRAPQDTRRRKGQWFVVQELKPPRNGPRQRGEARH